MGRKMYEKIQELSSGQPFTPATRTYVFSRTLPAGDLGGFTVVNEAIPLWLDGLNQEPGKDVWLVGGGKLVGQFLQARLVDEIGLTIHPRLLGSGVALFPPPYPETELELLRCTPYARGLVQVFYAVKC